MNQFVGKLVKTFTGAYYYVHSYNEAEQTVVVTKTNEYGVTESDKREVVVLELVAVTIIDG